MFVWYPAIIWTSDGFVYPCIYASLGLNELTHCDRDKMAANFLTTMSNTFSWRKMYKFWLKFHWSLFPNVQLTEPMMVNLLMHIRVTQPQWVNNDAIPQTDVISINDTSQNPCNAKQHLQLTPAEMVINVSPKLRENPHKLALIALE